MEAEDGGFSPATLFHNSRDMRSPVDSVKRRAA
jgi:hypothetical protein